MKRRAANKLLKKEKKEKKKNRSSWQAHREAASELGEAASTYTHLNTDCQYSAKILRNLPEQRKINKEIKNVEPGFNLSAFLTRFTVERGREGFDSQ